MMILPVQNSQRDGQPLAIRLGMFVLEPDDSDRALPAYTTLRRTTINRGD